MVAKEERGLEVACYARRMGSDEKTVHIVVAPGLILGVYSRSGPAETHARCITGAVSLPPIVIRDSIPPEILADVQSDDYEGDWADTDTPIEEVSELPDTVVVDVTSQVLGSPDARSSDEVAARPRGSRPPSSDH